jgi:hypothetical protein
MTAPAVTQTQVRARAAAIAWINAFIAASQEIERRALYRSLSLEFFDAGVQLIGCDGTAVFRAWVPGIEHSDAAWPLIEEVPDRAIVVMDPDGSGLGFVRALLRVTAEEGHEFEPLTISTGTADDEASLSLGEEFMTERLTLRACGQRIDLRLYDGAYPDWRQLRLGVEDIERVDGLTVATRLFGMVSKLKGTGAVDLQFYGEKRHIMFTARGETEVRGLIMPMRRRAAEEG